MRNAGPSRCRTTTTVMNSAFVLGTKMTEPSRNTAGARRSAGAEGGGKVEGLPAHIFISDDGDPDLKCPTEIGIHRPP